MRVNSDNKPAQAFASAVLLTGLAVCVVAIPLGPVHAEPPGGRKQRCEIYQEQFDAVRGKRKAQDGDKFKIALQWRRTGERFCNTGHTAEGQKVLRRALRMINIKPKDY